MTDLAWTPQGSPALGWVQVCESWANRRGCQFRGEALLTVMSETQEKKGDHTSTFQGDAAFILASISLAKAGHMAKPQSQGTEQRGGRDTEGVKNWVQ